MTVLAKRAFGQCFLVDRNIARIISTEATTPEGGTTLEIGAGTGALTEPLLRRAGCVVALERDRDLIPILRERFQGETRLRLVEADAVSADWAALVEGLPTSHSLAGNIPYQISGRLLQKAVETSEHFDRVVFLVQKEVAQRLLAQPSTKAYGALSVFVQSAFAVSQRVAVPASCFRPRPKVDSAVVIFTPRSLSPLTRSEEFALLVKAAFGQRRKTLRRAWSSVPEVEQLAQASGIDLDSRGETLGVADFLRAATWLRKQG